MSQFSTDPDNPSKYTDFLFGQNIEERVLLPAKDSSAVKGEDEKDEESAVSASNSSNPILPEKRKYEVITGEEDESNVLQIFCKLYLWDSVTAFWKEKGKGMLRLNDKMKDDKLCSRLVMRTAGSLKVILNSLIVSGMKFELSNEKCLRFTNIDGIYLFKGKDKDIEQLYSAIECRLRELSKKVKVESDENPDDNDEPSEGGNSKTSEDSTEDCKEELRQSNIDGIDLVHEELVNREPTSLTTATTTSTSTANSNEKEAKKEDETSDEKSLVDQNDPKENNEVKENNEIKESEPDKRVDQSQQQKEDQINSFSGGEVSTAASSSGQDQSPKA